MSVFSKIFRVHFPQKILRWLLVIALAGCAGNKNITSNSANYPKQNSSPSQVIKISGTIPAGMEVGFEATWAASEKSNNCKYYENKYLRFEGAPTVFHIVEPLKVARDKNNYQTEVIVDRFLPGVCNWRLEHVMYVVSRGTQEPDKWWIIRQPDGYEDERGNVTIWCKQGGSKTEKVVSGCSYWNESLRGKPQRAGVRIHSTITEVQVDFQYLE